MSLYLSSCSSCQNPEPEFGISTCAAQIFNLSTQRPRAPLELRHGLTQARMSPNRVPPQSKKPERRREPGDFEDKACHPRHGPRSGETNGPLNQGAKQRDSLHFTVKPSARKHA